MGKFAFVPGLHGPAMSVVKSTPSVGDPIYIRSCDDPSFIYEAYVDHYYVGDGAVDCEIENTRNPGQGGRTKGICSPKNCNICGWYYCTMGSGKDWPSWKSVFGYGAAGGALATLPAPPMPPPGGWVNPPQFGGPWPTPQPLPKSSDFKPVPKAVCKGKHCPDPYNPYAEPNQPDGSFKCYSCRQGIGR